jgi:hypothetical protein
MTRKLPEASPFERGKYLFGKYGSGRSDLSSTRKDVVYELLTAKHRDHRVGNVVRHSGARRQARTRNP